MHSIKKLVSLHSLKLCPFCGNAPKSYEYKIETSGDVKQFFASVRCSNRNCGAKPGTKVRGQNSYSGGDLSNDEARLKAINDWNHRAI